MATAPRPGVGARADAEQASITARIDGEEYTFRLADCTALDSAALRRETGLSVRNLLDAATADPDLDVAAAIIWLAHRQAGDINPDTKRPFTFEEIGAKIGYDTKIEALDAPTVEQDPDLPET